MGMLDTIKNFFGQLGAETGVAEPYHSPRVSDVPAEATAEMPKQDDRQAAEAVDVHRSDIPPTLPHELPLARDLPERPERGG